MTTQTMRGAAAPAQGTVPPAMPVIAPPVPTLLPEPRVRLGQSVKSSRETALT